MMEREEAEAAGIYTTDPCVAKEKIIHLQALRSLSPFMPLVVCQALWV